MSWFQEQLKYRKAKDNENFADALGSIASAVLGEKLAGMLDDRQIAISAKEEITKYYGTENLISRPVKLTPGWYKHASGAMQASFSEDGTAVALIPGKFSGYTYFDYKTGKRVKVNRKTEKLLDEEALCFYKPLPERKITVADLLKYMLSHLNSLDIILYFGMMILLALMGLLLPLANQIIFYDVLNSGSTTVLFALGTFMIAYAISRFFISSFQLLINNRIEIKENVAIQAAVMHRILTLPAKFFRDYSSGELTQRSTYIRSLCSILINTIATVSFTSLFSLIYVGEIYSFTPSLANPALIITLISAIFTLVATYAQMKITKKRMILASKTTGMTYAMITGIQKIKLAGAEKRMFSRWAKLYSESAALEYNPPKFIKLRETITLAISLMGTVIIYYLAFTNNVLVCNYYAFTAAYAVLSASFASFAGIATSLAEIKPTYEMAKPILEAEPELSEGKEWINELKGEIELSNITFKYEDDMPNVIEDLSLKIEPGEYVAIVGSTGFGKSTLMRLMLGFETPQKGNIFYDKKDINRIDIKSLRRKIGTVMQDGKLFLGDIYSNIVISAPELPLSKAWEAAEIASIADDIRRMPMGMNTVISEGQGGISGGQKQRLMIARAVAPHPKILMFDEATSALDNVTQKKVSEAIDSLDCTRIVIAHRLSTIKHCSRIIVLDKGHIIEDGTYDELIKQNGFFAELVKRQQISSED